GESTDFTDQMFPFRTRAERRGQDRGQACGETVDETVDETVGRAGCPAQETVSSTVAGRPGALPQVSVTTKPVSRSPSAYTNTYAGRPSYRMRWAARSVPCAPGMLVAQAARSVGLSTEVACGTAPWAAIVGSAARRLARS